MKYSLKRKSVSITLEDESGKAKKYELREMSAAKRDAYLTRLSTRIKTGEDGSNQGVSDFEGLQADLIATCLFDGDKQVDVATIQEWPASAVGGIFKEAQSLNSLDQEIAEAEAAAGNG